MKTRFPLVSFALTFIPAFLYLTSANAAGSGCEIEVINKAGERIHLRNESQEKGLGYLENTDDITILTANQIPNGQKVAIRTAPPDLVNPPPNYDKNWYRLTLPNDIQCNNGVDKIVYVGRYATIIFDKPIDGSSNSVLGVSVAVAEDASSLLDTSGNLLPSGDWDASDVVVLDITRQGTSIITPTPWLRLSETGQVLNNPPVAWDFAGGGTFSFNAQIRSPKIGGQRTTVQELSGSLSVVDSTVPSITIDIPTTTQVIGDEVTVSGTWSDPHDAWSNINGNVELVGTGKSSPIELDQSDVGRWVASLNVQEAGNFDIKATIKDVAGNSSDATEENALEVKSKFSANQHPGHYINFSSNQEIPTESLEKPGVTGAILRLWWNNIEPIDDEFNFAAIDDALAVAKTTGDRIIVMPIDRTFAKKTEDGPDPIPGFMQGYDVVKEVNYAGVVNNYWAVRADDPYSSTNPNTGTRRKIPKDLYDQHCGALLQPFIDAGLIVSQSLKWSDIALDYPLSNGDITPKDPESLQESDCAEILDYSMPYKKAGATYHGVQGVRWTQYYIDEYAEMVEAIADRYLNNPDFEEYRDHFEGVALQETAVGGDSSSNGAYSYNTTSYADLWQGLITRLAKNDSGALKDRSLFVFFNWLRSDADTTFNDATEKLNTLVKEVDQYPAVILGGPDILPNNDKLVDFVYSIYPNIEGVDGHARTFASAQQDSYKHLYPDTPGEDEATLDNTYKPKEIFYYAVGCKNDGMAVPSGNGNPSELDADYVFWNNYTRGPHTIDTALNDVISQWDYSTDSDSWIYPDPDPVPAISCENTAR